MRPFPRRLLWISSLLTGATGLVYMWMKYLLEPVDAWAVINHPLQPLVLKAHILVAPVMVFAVGLIAGDHIWRHYRQGVRAGRRSGLLAMGVFVPMVLTGYLIQAVTHVTWLQAVAWSHMITGMLYLVGLLLHHRVFRTRRTEERSVAEVTATRPRQPPSAAPPRGGDPAAGSTHRRARPRPARSSAGSASARGRRRARPREDRP